MTLVLCCFLFLNEWVPYILSLNIHKRENKFLSSSKQAGAAGFKRIPVVTMLMPSFCQVITGRGVPVASHGSRTGLFTMTSSVPGCVWITGGSAERKTKENAIGLTSKARK